MSTENNIFLIPQVLEKISQTPQMIQALHRGIQFEIPQNTARDIQVLRSKLHPEKKGLSTAAGRGRLLHDLASIELQALELALRTLVEFPEAPAEFKEQLELLALSEAAHLKLCLDGMSSEQTAWGDFPVHLALWEAVRAEDTLLDRILIVHRYLEGSGLDAGFQFIRRLEGIHGIEQTLQIVRQINNEEVDHVLFGSHWYRQICRQQHLDPDQDFKSRIEKLRGQLPKRVEGISTPLRQKAGFSDSEIEVLQDLRQSFLKVRPSVK